MNYKSPYYISLVYLLVLLVGSIVLYKERMLFIDPAFITFEIINTKSFVFSEHRYGAFITQLFPLICVYLGAHVQMVLLLYSVSFYLFYMFVAFVSGSILHQKMLSILFVFYLCFIVSDVYFWPNNEVHQAVGWMILFMSLYSYSMEKAWKGSKIVHLGLIGCLFLAIISHMLIVVPLTFLWLYINIDGRFYSTQIKYFLLYSGLLLFFVGIRYYLSQNSWYDGAKLHGIKHFNLESLVNALQNDHSVSISKLLVTKYWPVVALFIGGLGSLVYQNKYTLALLTVSSAIAYYLLVVLTYTDKITDNNLFYFESQWMGLTLIVCSPFLFDTLRLIPKQSLVISLFACILIWKVPGFVESISKFTLRLSNLEALVDDAQEKQIQKSYITPSEDLNNRFLLTWGIPIETMLLSSLNDKEAALSIKVFEEDLKPTISSDSIYSAFTILPISALNLDFFSISSKTSYQPLYE